MKSKRNFQFSLGWSSILMVFVVLCLTAFGILSYVTANADYKISEKTSQTMQEYYTASRQAEVKLQQIDEAVLQARSDAKQASSSGTCDGLENGADYAAVPSVETVLKSPVTIDEKYQACCAAFSRVLLSNLGVAFPDGSEASLPLSGTFDVADGTERKIQVSLTIDPLSEDERCRVVSSRLVSSQSGETESEPTLNLWQEK